MTAVCERCERCGLELRACVCELIVPVVSRTHFVVLRHVAERVKRSNSARLAALAMPELELRDYGGRQPACLDDLGAPGTALLFPEGSPASGPAPTRLVVLDGSWAQARRMRRKLAHLRLPTVNLTGLRRSAERLRCAPRAGLVSTLEAIAGAIARYEGNEAAAPLYALYDQFVRRARETGRYPQRRRVDP